MSTWWTIGLQAINFLALVWLLHRFLYRPVLATIAERKRRAEEATAKIAEVRGEAERMQSAIERDRAGIATERDRALEEARAKAATERDELIASAKAEAAHILAGARASLADERAAALVALEGHATKLAIEIATRLVTELGDPAIDDAFLARVEARLDGLPSERLRAFAAEAAAGFEVVTAHPLAADALERWRRGLRDRLGDAASPTFSVDPALVAGAELHFRTAVVHASWRDTLGRAGEIARQHAAAG